MAYILHLETSSSHCSVALSASGELVQSMEAGEAFSHARVLTVLISDLLDSTGVSLDELGAVAINLGPGSYTALRVGLSVAKGLCFGGDIPLITCTSFEVLVNQAPSDFEGICIPMIDARRDEVYMQVYRSGREVTKAQSFVLDENLLLAEVGTDKNILIIGDAASKAPQWLEHGLFTFQEVHLSATMLVSQSWHKFEAGTFSDLAYTIPFYLKPPNIVVSKKKYF